MKTESLQDVSADILRNESHLLTELIETVNGW